MKKRIFAMVLCALLPALALIACGTKAICDFCGAEKYCETRTVWDEELHICDDCLDELESLYE